MNPSPRVAGMAFIVAVLLMFTRMVPIFASGAIAPQDFPPDTVEVTVALARSTQTGTEISHLMLLIALVLFFAGTLVLYGQLAGKGQATLALFAVVVSSLGLLLYAIAGVLDGFLLPAVANGLGLLSTIPEETAQTLVGFSHETALSFFGQAQTAIILGVGLWGVALWRARLYGRWLSMSGVTLSALALLGLIAGVFDLHWRTFETAGPALLLFFVWHLALGLSMVRDQRATTRAEVDVILNPDLTENAT